MNRMWAVGAITLTLFLLLGIDNAVAQSTMSQPGESTNDLLALIQAESNGWADTLRGFAIRLFWSLALIQLIWTFFPLVIKNADIAEIVGELIKFILVIGFFAALLTYSVEWSTAIVDSFRLAGGHASGTDSQMAPGDVVAKAVQFAVIISDGMTLTGIGLNVLLAVGAILVALCFAFIGIFMFVTLVESYIVINAAVLFMGFGGSQWTRDYAITMFRYAVGVGAKLFVLTLLVALVVGAADSWQAQYNSNQEDTLTIICLALLCAYLCKTIPELVQGLITGVSPGTGSAVGTMAALAVAAASAGAGLAAAGAAGAANAAGAATNAAGGAASTGGNLASNLTSSLSSMSSGGSGSGGAAPSAPPTPPSGGGGGGASSAPPTPPSGGGGGEAPSTPSSPPGGGGGGGAPSTPSSPPGGSGGGDGADSGGSSAASSGSTIGGGQSSGSSSLKPAASGGSNGGDAQKPDGGHDSAAALKGIAATAKTAQAGLKGMGVMGALTVPGMENAAAAPGPAPGEKPPTDGDGGGEYSSDTPAQPPEREGNADNVIRPANADEPATSPPGDGPSGELGKT